MEPRNNDLHTVICSLRAEKELVIMRVLRMCVVLIVVFVSAGVCYSGDDTAEVYFYKGVEYGVQGSFKEAKGEFEKALKIDPFYSPAKECLELIEYLTDKKIKNETAIHIFKAVDYVNKRMWDYAITELSKAIKQNPSYAFAYINRGAAYDTKGQYDQAISDLNKAIEINPRLAVAYYNRGNVYSKKGQHEQAISDLNKAIEINPRDADTYMSRGAAYYIKGQHDQAISDINKAIEINPRLALAYQTRGLIYMVKLRDKKRACSDWKRACELGVCEAYDLAKTKGDCK